MRILVAWLLCLALNGFAQAQTPINVTVLCYASYPPYSYAENGAAKGLYSEILRAAFARMPGYRVSIRPVPWPRGLAALEKGTAFALFPPYHRPVERPWMDYSRPILEESVVAFVRSGLAQQRAIADFPGAYAGLRIGDRTLTLQPHPEFDAAYVRALAIAKADIVGEKVAAEAVDSLTHGKADDFGPYILDFIDAALAAGRR